MRTENKREESQTQSMGPEDFRDFVRLELRNRVQNFAVLYVEELIGEELMALCGRAGAQIGKRNLAHRGGSQPGWVALDGQRIRIQKQRARKEGREIRSERYAALQDRRDLRAHVEQVMLAGISTRGYDVLLDKTESSLGFSKSAVSREFVKASRESLNELNSRTFPDQTFWCIVLDGIAFGGSIAIVALGVDTSGEKHFLGVSEGSTENFETCMNLLQSISARGVKFTDRVLTVMDGSKALEKAVHQFFGDTAERQLCYLHRMRNVLAKLPRKYHGEFCRRYRRAFAANRYEDAEEEMNKIVLWLQSLSFSAAESLKDGIHGILTLHKIGMGSALRLSFYTTNLIDSAFSNPRSHLNRVKRTQPKTDQVLRWVGALLYEQEKQFRRVRSYRSISNFLITFLQKDVAEKKSA